MLIPDTMFTEIAVEIATGLWIILSIVINDLIVASSAGTDNLWLVPIPLIVVKVTAVPAEAKLAATATLITSFVSFIAYTSDGNIFVTPTPGTVVFSIPIAVWPTPGAYFKCSAVLNSCLGIVTWSFDVLIPEDGLNSLCKRESPALNILKLVVPITPPPTEVTIPVNCVLISSINKTLLVLDSL